MEIKLENLRPEQIEAIKNQIAEYEKENEKPKDGIDYEHGWAIYKNSIWSTSCFVGSFIEQIYSIGLYRDTKEEAEKLLRKMQIEHRLRQWAKMCKEKVDFRDTYQSKYYIVFDVNCNELEINSDEAFVASEIYFTDESILQRAIEDIGEQNLIDNYFVEV